MKELCDYCVKNDICCYKEKRERLNEEFYPFQMRCSLYQKKMVASAKDIETAPVLNPNNNKGKILYR